MAWFRFNSKCRGIKCMAKGTLCRDRALLPRSRIVQILFFKPAGDEVVHGHEQRTHASHS